MSDLQCPAPKTWEAFLIGKLPAEESKPLVRHLLRRCADCSQQLAVLGAPLFRQTNFQPARLESFEFPVERGIRAALQATTGLRAARAIAQSEVWMIAELGDVPPPAPAELEGPELWWEQAGAWLAHAKKQRHEDPETTLIAALFAERSAAKLTRGAAPQGNVSDLRAEIWAEIGNARRLLGSFAEAESALGCALKAWREGTRSRRLQAWMTEILAQVMMDSRRFAEAETLLSRVLALRTDESTAADAGKTLLLLASTAGYRGDNPRAVRLLLEALPLLARDGDPQVVLFALHNLMGRVVDLGRFPFAAEMLLALRPHLETLSGATDRVKLLWVEGRIAAGLDRWSVAEHLFRGVRRRFADLGLPFHVALVTLDYGALLLRQRRTGELRLLLDEVIKTFLGLGIGREALAAVLLLQNALATERATIALVESAAREIQALEGRR